MTRDIEALIRKKEAQLRNRQLGSRESLEVYRGYRSLPKKEIGRTKRGHEIDLADKIRVNPKKFFKYIRGKRETRERTGPLKDQSGHACVEPQEMGDVFNEYFSSVFTVEKDMKTWIHGGVSGNILGSVHITGELVLEVLESMKVDKSTGPDQIYLRPLQEAKEEIAGTLADIFTSSLALGEVPEDWRVANIVSLFKKGCKEKLGNYRPVSLTSVI
eukprot:g41064.t1